MDVFILARYRSDIPRIIQTIRGIEQRSLHAHRTGLSTLFEQAALSSEDDTHIHVLAIGEDELRRGFLPRSLRLRIITLLFSRKLLVGYFKHRTRLLFGERLPQRTALRRRETYPRLGLRGRWSVCAMPAVLALIVPLMRLSRDEFRVWCFKIIWYQSDLAAAYLRTVTGDRTVSIKHLLLDHDAMDMVTAYRYKPRDYYGSRLGLYIRVWQFLLRNLSFLWRGVRTVSVAEHQTTNETLPVRHVSQHTSSPVADPVPTSATSSVE